MKVRMLGRDIEISRQRMLSDGYCLSTVKHAERISADGKYEVKSATEDTPGMVWLRDHSKFCLQCWCANAYKVRLVEYLEGQHPGLLTAYHQGRLSESILANAFRSIRKASPKFVDEILGIVRYNMAPPNIQATMDFNVFSQDLIRSLHPMSAILPRAQIIRIDTELVFDAWQLLGSAPAYDNSKLLIDWRAGRISLPFPVTYFSFSEGVNDHLVKNFFDNVPAAMFGPINVHGFLAVNDGGKTFMSERASSCDIEESDREVSNLCRSRAEQRAFFWIVLLRALQDEVFSLEKGPEATTVEKPKASPWVKDKAPAQPQTAPIPFYAVRSNPKKAFSSPTRRYGKRHINWTHRWNVTGHWRTYKDGSKVWINSYIKGPEGKPLIPSVRVYSATSWAARGQNAVVGLVQRVWRWFRNLGQGGAQ